jgi:hypothetical protein
VMLSSWCVTCRTGPTGLTRRIDICSV